MAPLPPAQAFQCAASASDQETQVQALAASGLLVERSVPSLSSMPTPTLMPLPPAYTQNPTEPLARVRATLLPGAPAPDSRRTDHAADVAGSSFSSTRSEQ